MRCPSCRHDNGPDRRFCTECGAVLSAARPSCGAPIQAGEKFCGGCEDYVAWFDRRTSASRTFWRIR